MELTNKQEVLYKQFQNKYKKEELSSMSEAEKLADMYQAGISEEAKNDILKVTLFCGGNWDTITRSIAFFNIFEERISKKIPLFWDPVKGTIPSP